MTLARVVLPAVGLVILLLVLATQWLTRRVEARFPPVGRFATVDGVRLHYIDIPADKPDLAPMIFLHGASGNARDLHGALSGPLAGRARMIFPDRPGAGYSQRGGAGMAAPDRQARLIAGLMSELDLERAVIVGHSLGAGVAAAFAVEFPARTLGLVLVSPATHPWPGGGVTWYYDLVNMPVVGWIFTETLAVPLGNLVYREALKGVFTPDRVPGDYPERSGTRLVLRPANFRDNAADVGGLFAHVTRLSKRYGEIAAPTVIITGDADTVVLPEIHSAGLARDIAGSRLVTLPTTGHMPPYPRTGAIIAEIEHLNATISKSAELR